MQGRRNHEKRHIQSLKRRYRHLLARIEATDKHLSYDEAEASALRWAIELLEAQFPNAAHAPTDQG